MTPHRMKTIHLYFMTGNRAIRAASALPPMARRRNPNKVRWRINQNSPKKAASQTTWIGIANGNCVAPSARKSWSSPADGGGRFYWGLKLDALLRSSSVPSAMLNIPSVAMNDGMRTTVVKNALIAPVTAPMPIARARARTNGR